MSLRSTIHFFGGAGTVTGSNFLLDDRESSTRLLIDCGLFQGPEFLEKKNWEAFPFEPSAISAVIITHAHIDHIGRIPKLVRDGFKGRIISTEATRMLAEPMLLDSMELLAHAAQKHGRELLYTEHDIAASLKQWEGISYHEHLDLGGYTLEFRNAGHILGSAMVLLRRQASDGQARSIIFTGDIGGNSPLLAKAEPLSGSHYAVMESVYGNKTREPEDRMTKLQTIVEDTARREGTLLIPAFSTERTQDILFELRQLFIAKKVPSMPVYMDSPLAQKITHAFLSCPDYFKEDIAMQVRRGENIFLFPEVKFVQSTEESRSLRRVRDPKIIIAGSGMSAGGRILAHEKELLPEKRTTLLSVGYQAAGGIGRRLLEGAKEIEIMGEKIAVRCTIETLLGYSAHLDSPHLLEIAMTGTETLEQLFIVMGEPAASSYLAQRIRDYAGIKATTPEPGSSVDVHL